MGFVSRIFIVLHGALATRLSPPRTRTSHPRSLSALSRRLFSAQVSSRARDAPAPSRNSGGLGEGERWEAPWLGLAPTWVLTHPSHRSHGTSRVLPDSSDGLEPLPLCLPTSPSGHLTQNGPGTSHKLQPRQAWVTASRKGLGKWGAGGHSPSSSFLLSPHSAKGQRGWHPQAGCPQQLLIQVPQVCQRQGGGEAWPQASNYELVQGGKGWEGVFSLRWKFLLHPGRPRAGSRLGEGMHLPSFTG